MGKGGGSRSFSPGLGTGLIAGSAMGGGGGSGGALFGSCSQGDTSFFCRLTKFTSVISQVIYLLAIIVGGYMFFKYLRGKK